MRAKGFTGGRSAFVMAAAVAIAVAAGLALPACAASQGMALMTIRARTGIPGGIELRWAPSGGSEWWGAAVAFERSAHELEALWAGHLWALGSDNLSQLGVQAGYNLPKEEPQWTSGPWVGFYAGQQWRLVPVALQFGASLRVPVDAPQHVWWETSAGIGLSW
ncbi:MAG: hypothetical protein IMX02_07160 [Limnochordaceae bacterium]|nr:hypothetical protein [Limnochordaceae bacterium]